MLDEDSEYLGAWPDPGSDDDTEPPPRLCEHCLVEIESKRSDARFCGPECRLKAHRGIPRPTDAGEVLPAPEWGRKWTPAPSPVISAADAVSAARVLDEILSRRPDLPPEIRGALFVALDWVSEEWTEAAAWFAGRFSRS